MHRYAKVASDTFVFVVNMILPAISTLSVEGNASVSFEWLDELDGLYPDLRHTRFARNQRGVSRMSKRRSSATHS